MAGELGEPKGLVADDCQHDFTLKKVRVVFSGRVSIP
jgi:hypothetical protein